MTRPVTVAPSRMASGGSVMPTLTWYVRLAGSAWGETSRTRPVAFTCGSLVSAISTTGSRGPVRISCSGTSKTASRPPCTRDLDNHCPGTDHFARFGADRGDRTGGIG